MSVFLFIMKKSNNKLWLLIFLIYLSAIPPLTTDMYLPALPSMVDQFKSTVGLVNLTLVLFFVFFSGSILVWGTLSDKYGRKPVLVVSTIVFTASSFLCALSTDVYQLISFRVFQAIGGGAALSVSMAIMKDAFEGKERARAIAICNIFMVIAPITAPIIGAMILKFLSWRGIFIVLGGSGVIAVAGSIIMRETAQIIADKSVLNTIGNLLKVLKIPGFAYPLPIIAIMGCPIFLYIGASADIFVTGFGLSEQVYSLFFGANAMFSALGSGLYLVISRYLGTLKIIYTSFFFLFISGVTVVLFGHMSPLIFAVTLLPGTIGATLIRAPSSNLLLEQTDENAGAASSMMTFSFAFVGSLCMQFISLDWSSRIFVMGLFYVITGLGSFLIWPFVYRKCKRIE